MDLTWLNLDYMSKCTSGLHPWCFSDFTTSVLIWVFPSKPCIKILLQGLESKDLLVILCQKTPNLFELHTRQSILRPYCGHSHKMAFIWLWPDTKHVKKNSELQLSIISFAKNTSKELERPGGIPRIKVMLVASSLLDNILASQLAFQIKNAHESGEILNLLRDVLQRLMPRPQALSRSRLLILDITLISRFLWLSDFFCRLIVFI